jgi:hypothetical protein
MWPRNTVDIPITSLASRASWCVVEVNDTIFRAEIIHTSRGKFEILKDNQRNIYVGMIIDASDVVICEV